MRTEQSRTKIWMAVKVFYSQFLADFETTASSSFIYIFCIYNTTDCSSCLDFMIIIHSLLKFRFEVILKKWKRFEVKWFWLARDRWTLFFVLGPPSVAVRLCKLRFQAITLVTWNEMIPTIHTVLTDQYLRLPDIFMVTWEHQDLSSNVR